MTRSRLRGGVEMTKPAAFDFPGTFVHLDEGSSAVPIEVTDSFWPDLVSGKLALGPGRLVSFSEFDADWESWEIHPNGDEIVLLISGAMDLWFEQADGTTILELRKPGGFALVPRGTWHTAKVHEPSRAAFITAGDGTQHRPA